ncbi:hypothetical protein AB0D45_00225 [Streptomyces sp. NPDC048352]|uniref:hypothetical protein n=1 Tax=Streptomyces sp. NPDC048352 TaxID=3154718 RepID=UPI00343674B7
MTAHRYQRQSNATALAPVEDPFTPVPLSALQEQLISDAIGCDPRLGTADASQHERPWAAGRR